MDECDWAFGVEHENYVGHPRYMRFARWGEDTQLLQPAERDWERVLREKTRFCAFVYANRVFYREAFMRALARYKAVDAPGVAMNNMPSIDRVPGKRSWDDKIAFLRKYKFVIAFENSSWPGYNTEKLTHAIEADSLPVYWGDPEVARSYNVGRFINSHDYLPRPRRLLPRLPYAPHALAATTVPSLAGRIARKANGISAKTEQRLWAAAGFDALIERIVAIDQNDTLYIEHLRQPFLIDNQLPDRTRWIARWRQILMDAARMYPA
jgi:alpha(1,3/1,4) fucosyltransferase